MDISPNNLLNFLFFSDAHFTDLDNAMRFVVSNYNSEDSFTKEHILGKINISSNDQISSNYRSISNLKSIANRIKECVSSFFSSTINTQLFIVDSLPVPFSDRPWKAMSVDTEQSKIFHIEEGVYFKSDYIIPAYFEIIFCHELIHQALNRLSPIFHTPAASLCEEGLCDYFSYYILLTNRIVAYEDIYRFISCNRVLSEKWRYYWISTCNISYLIKSYLNNKECNLEFDDNIKKIVLDFKYDNHSVEKIEDIILRGNSLIPVSLDEYRLFYYVKQCESITNVCTKLDASLESIMLIAKSLLSKNLLYNDDSYFYNYSYSLINNLYYSL